ncbi:MAG: A24 family peptidase [Clostridia bacterium]|nr:A24 family peptidase [Clostridia bacterium]
MVQTVETIALVIIGGFLGYFGIWFFNRMPQKWLLDYGQEPFEEEGQRIKSYPFKYLMVAFMAICAVKLSLGDIYIALGSLMAIWALMLIAIADKKYQIIPDQLVIVLMMSAISFVHRYVSYKVPLFGGLIAFGVMVLIALLGKLIYRRYVIGGGDIKVYTALGIIFGARGFLAIFIMATLLSAVHFGYLLIRKKAKKDEERPLAIYIFLAALIYLVILYPGINEILL